MERTIQVQAPVPEGIWQDFKQMLEETQEPVKVAVVRVIAEAVERHAAGAEDFRLLGMTAKERRAEG